MFAALDRAGNPSSIHAEGRAARAIVERARAQLHDAREQLGRGLEPPAAELRRGEVLDGRRVARAQRNRALQRAGAAADSCISSYFLSHAAESFVTL